jgi:periplasmic copper chaperone A
VRRALAAVVTSIALGATACGGSSGAARGIQVSEAWARTTPPGVSVGVVYLTATSSTQDALTGADVDPRIAAKVELHTESTSGSMTSMQAVSSLPVADGKPLVLDPLGDHLMLVDLTGPLTSGERFDVTLHFADAGAQRVHVEVRDDAP